MRHLSLSLLLLITVGGCIPYDHDHDGVLRVACLGSSNTAIGWDTTPKRWCEYAADLCPGVQWINLAVAGTKAVEHGPGQMTNALAAAADSVVIGLGTNDITGLSQPPKTPDQVVDALRGMCNTAAYAGLTCNVLTLPPNAFVDVGPTNAAIIAAAITPDMLIDSTTAMVLYDALHIDDASEQLLAIRVVARVCPP